MSQGPSAMLTAMIALGAMMTSCTSSEFSGGGEAKAGTSRPVRPEPTSQDARGSDGDDQQEDPEVDLGTQAPLEEVSTDEGCEASGPKSKVDIVFFVDTSGSMHEEKERLEANLASFVERFLQDPAGLDYKVFLVGVGFAFPGATAQVIPREVDSHDGLAIARDVLSGGSGLRSGARKELVFVTDDDAGAGLIGGLIGKKGFTDADFRGFVEGTPALAGKVRVNGFVGLQDGRQSDWCKIVAIGSSYISLAGDPEYAGVIQDLCSEDWGRLFDVLGEQITTGC